MSLLSQSPDRVRILHISDLHFVKRLTEDGTRLRTRHRVTKSHSFARLEALTSVMTWLGWPQSSFDHLIVTGDVSTDGSHASLGTAEFFLSSDRIPDAAAHRIRGYGLGAHADRRTVIPGNHDRYGRLLPVQTRQRHLESVFEPFDYPATKVLPGLPGTGRPDIIVFIFDSTQVLGLRPRWNPLGRIARGEVAQGECDWLSRTCRTIATTGAVDGVPVDVTNCIRVVLLHHHPVVPQTRGRLDFLKEMDHADAFRRNCMEAGINLVLFGHQHRSYDGMLEADASAGSAFGGPTPIHFFCCASTSEYSEPSPGFNIYDIGSRDVEAYQFEWREAGFTRTPRMTRRPF
jgi:3',5'-cyclic AMP phosphodiesterase CpdA